MLRGKQQIYSIHFHILQEMEQMHVNSELLSTKDETGSKCFPKERQKGKCDH